MKIGFIVNPIAGMGGSVGLKGTDNLYDEALRLGAKPVAPEKARQFLIYAMEYVLEHEIISCGGEMGEIILKSLNLKNYEIVYYPGGKTTREDTIECAKILSNSSIIVFVGGDGTARDIVKAIDEKVPILGIPSGVKMYSAVFASSVHAGSETLRFFLEGKAQLMERELMDINEEMYRKNSLDIKLYGYAKVPYVPDYVQNSKAEIYSTEEEEDKQGIAEFFIDTMDMDALYLLGPGTTVKKITELLNLNGTLLGFDALYKGKIIANDLNEKLILELLDKFNKITIVLTPIGNQGFILGRGNLQITERVLEKIRKEDIMILATPSKLSGIKNLIIDIGDQVLEKKFTGYYKVITGYGRMKMYKVISL